MNALLRLFRRRPRHELRHATTLSRIADGSLKLSAAAANSIFADSLDEIHEDFRQAADDDRLVRTVLPIVVTLIFVAGTLAGIWQALRSAGIVQ